MNITRTMLSQDGRLSVRLSVRPSHAGIVSKRLHISSNFFTSGSYTILVFRTKRHGNIPTATSLLGCRMQGYEEIAIFDQYLSFSWKQYKIGP